VLSRFDPARPGSVVAGAVVIGVLAGLAAVLLLTVTGEPSIAEAIRIEQARADPVADQEEPVVSRDVQEGVGLFGAYALSGAGFGLLFAAGFVTARRGRPDPFRRALVVGAVLAGGMTVSPWLKYPPNPPAVGDPGTLARRQVWYVALVVLSLAVLAVAAHVSRRLRAAGWQEARRVACVTAVVVVPLGVAYAIFPPPPDLVAVPATLLWRFRLASLGGNLALWAVLTLGFGLLASQRRAPVETVRAAT
jgi:predicted cobalt transporter CbtA